MEVRDSNRHLLQSAKPGTCSHCGLPLPERATTPFCCSGCAVAFEAIRLAGLDQTYYSLRNLSPGAYGVSAKPRSSSVVSRQHITSDRFIRESTEELDDGARRICLSIDGLTCAACGWLAEQVVTAQPGMREASVNMPDATLTFVFDPRKSSLAALLETLGRFGYSLHPRTTRRDGASPEERRLLMRVGASWALAGNIMLLAFTFYSGLSLTSDFALATAARWASFVIATVSVAYGGSVFFRTAAASLRIAIRNRSLRRLHIDTPISLGILVGYSHSAWSTITGDGALWFDSIAVLIAALLTARWLQMRSQRRAAQAASRLLDMVPSTARRISPSGIEDYVPSDEIDRGDTIRVDPGEAVPVDGTVLSGKSRLNNAVITGESALVNVEAGDSVFAGSINQSTPLVLRADASGKGTRVGQLLEWLDQSSGDRAPVVQVTDRLSGVFVLGILAASIATLTAGSILFPDEVLNRVVALLVIACPCALGMATPLAIAAANGKAARRGIYVKDGSTVEKLAAVSTVVFDKTGTLTEGNLAVVEFAGDDSILQLAAALEKYSRHLIGAALVREAEDRCGYLPDVLSVTDVEEYPGLGIAGQVGENSVVVGKPEWVLRRMSVDDHQDEFGHRASRFADAGLTPVLIAVDGRASAVVGLGDRVRPHAAEEIERLRSRSIRVLLLSGDHASVVRTVAAAVGIEAEDAFGDVSPEDKRRLVEDLRKDSVVMMIGDGANDAAALRSADVGVAVGNENAPCLVASDIFVPAVTAASVVPLLVFGERVLKLIRRNLTVSLLYNVAAGGAAVFGLVTPLVAAIAMPLSSLFVVSTSGAIRPFGRERSPDGGHHAAVERYTAVATPYVRARRRNKQERI